MSVISSVCIAPPNAIAVSVRAVLDRILRIIFARKAVAVFVLPELGNIEMSLRTVT